MVKESHITSEQSTSPVLLNKDLNRIFSSKIKTNNRTMVSADSTTTSTMSTSSTLNAPLSPEIDVCNIKEKEDVVKHQLPPLPTITTTSISNGSSSSTNNNNQINNVEASPLTTFFNKSIFDSPSKPSSSLAMPELINTPNLFHNRADSPNRFLFHSLDLHNLYAKSPQMSLNMPLVSVLTPPQPPPSSPRGSNSSHTTPENLISRINSGLTPHHNKFLPNNFLNTSPSTSNNSLLPSVERFGSPRGSWNSNSSSNPRSRWHRYDTSSSEDEDEDEEEDLTEGEEDEEDDSSDEDDDYSSDLRNDLNTTAETSEDSDVEINATTDEEDASTSSSSSTTLKLLNNRKNHTQHLPVPTMTSTSTTNMKINTTPKKSTAKAITTKKSTAYSNKSMKLNHNNSNINNSNNINHENHHIDINNIINANLNNIQSIAVGGDIYKNNSTNSLLPEKSVAIPKITRKAATTIGLPNTDTSENNNNVDASSADGLANPKKRKKNGADAGRWCHQCKALKFEFIQCQAADAGRPKCNKRFCSTCLSKHYNKEVSVLKQRTKPFVCAFCKLSCCCAACKRKYQNAPQPT